MFIDLRSVSFAAAMFKATGRKFTVRDDNENKYDLLLLTIAWHYPGRTFAAVNEWLENNYDLSHRVPY